MKRQGIELNGLANISLALQLEANIKPDGLVTMNLETLTCIQDQLQLLERYMLAYNKAVSNGLQTPHWHEVRDNPTIYPLNRDAVG